MLSDETAQACRNGAEAMRKLAIHEIDGATYVKQPEATLAARLDLVQRTNASWNIVTCDDVCKEQVGENGPSILQSCIDGCKIPDDDNIDDYCRWFTGYDGAMNTMLSDETAQACRKGAEAMRKLAIHEIDGATYVKQPEATLAARLDLVQRTNASWNIVTCDDVCKEQVGENRPSILQSCIDGCKILDDVDIDDYCRWFTGYDG